MSLWQIAQAAVRISASPAPGSASSTVSIAKGAPKARQTAALVFMREIRSKSAAREAVSPAREAKVQAQSCGGREQFLGCVAGGGGPAGALYFPFPRRPKGGARLFTR